MPAAPPNCCEPLPAVLSVPSLPHTSFPCPPQVLGPRTQLECSGDPTSEALPLGPHLREDECEPALKCDPLPDPMWVPRSLWVGGRGVVPGELGHRALWAKEDPGRQQTPWPVSSVGARVQDAFSASAPSLAPRDVGLRPPHPRVCSPRQAPCRVGAGLDPPNPPCPPTTLGSQQTQTPPACTTSPWRPGSAHWPSAGRL